MVCGVTDLHLHLDGSLSIAAVKTLAAMENIPLGISDSQLRQRLSVSPECRDLNEYLEKFDFPLQLLQSEKAITFAVKDLCKRLVDNGLWYAEIRFAPQLHMKNGLSQAQAVEAAVTGILSFEAENIKEFSCSLILCCMRSDNNRQLNLDTVETAARFLSKGVCAVDLAGAEGLYPTKNFEEIFRYANELNVPFTIHAGEAAGPDSIRCALSFGAKRIGHGIQAVKDEALIKQLADEQIPLELCPTSNLNTRIFESPYSYPVRKLIDGGVKVTVNTDNMTVSDTNIKKEFEFLKKYCNLSDEILHTIVLNGIDASFAAEEYKEKMHKRLAQAKNV